MYSMLTVHFQVVGHSAHKNLRTCPLLDTQDRRLFIVPYLSFVLAASTVWIWTGSIRKDPKTRRTLCFYWKVKWQIRCCTYFYFYFSNSNDCYVFVFPPELREAFEAEAQEVKKPRLMLTAAVAVGPDNIKSGYDVPAVSS
jgi:hypothetical protein